VHQCRNVLPTEHLAGDCTPTCSLATLSAQYDYDLLHHIAEHLIYICQSSEAISRRWGDTIPKLRLMLCYNEKVRLQLQPCSTGSPENSTILRFHTLSRTSQQRRHCYRLICIPPEWRLSVTPILWQESIGKHSSVTKTYTTMES